MLMLCVVCHYLVGRDGKVARVVSEGVAEGRIGLRVTRPKNINTMSPSRCLGFVAQCLCATPSRRGTLASIPLRVRPTVARSARLHQSLWHGGVEAPAKSRQFTDAVLIVEIGLFLLLSLGDARRRYG
jgi:hypothetical protein